MASIRGNSGGSGHMPADTLYRPFSLVRDVIDDKGVASTSVHLANKEARVTGQQWFLSSWGDGSFRLTNEFTGPTKHFDVFLDTKKVSLGAGDHSGQHWHLTRIFR